MADNVAITAGSGTSIATDDVSGVHFQKVKLAVGGDDKAQVIAPAVYTIVTGTTTDTAIASSSGILWGVNFFTTEAAGAGLLVLRDSTSSSTGNRMCAFWLSTGAGASRSSAQWFGPQGLKFNKGLRFESLSTAVSNVVTYFSSPA